MRSTCCAISPATISCRPGRILGEGDERTLVNLLTDQIEFADVVVLNKTTDAGPERTDAARKIIKALNPDARLIETDHARVDPAAIFDTGLFDFDRAHEHPLWAKELYGFAHHTPETEEYGIPPSSIARGAVSSARIHAVLNGDLPGVIRAKGHFWIATRPDWVAEFSLAGAMSSVSAAGRLVGGGAARAGRPPGCAGAKSRKNWQEPWGDRRQETRVHRRGHGPAAIRARWTRLRSAG
jgi:G3E family GTPase